MMTLLTKAQLQAERDAKIRSKQTQLNRDRLAIVYIRQSGANAPLENKESRGAQSDDLVALAIDEYCWSEDKIFPIDENRLDKRGNTLDKPRGVSGRLGSDARAGLRIAEELIEQDKVGAIFIREVSRLFRDPDRISPPRFADLCKKHHCVILTPYAEYDFNATLRDDQEKFLDAAQAAGKELEVLYRRMHAGKERKGMRGEYVGQIIPTGFMLDEERKHLVPNLYWAGTVAWLTKRFRELDGSLAELYAEIRGRPIFKKLPDDISARVGQIRLQPVPGGYTVASRQSLVHMLVNPANVGHAVFKTRIVKRDAHPAIVDKLDFDYAVAHLEKVDLENNPIERPERVRRFAQEHTRREGLLAGVRSGGSPVITSNQGSVYVFQGGGCVCYVIKDNRPLVANAYSGSVSIDTVDNAVSQRLEEKLSTLMFHAEIESDLGGDSRDGAQAIVAHVAALRQQVRGSLVKLDETIIDIEKAIAHKQREYTVAKDVMSDTDIREHFAALARLRSRLSDLREKQAQSMQVDQDIQVVTSHLSRARAEWSSMALEQRRSFIRLITENIVLDALSDRWMRLEITWHHVLAGDNYVETVVFLKSNGAGSNWSAEEDSILREMYPESKRSDILAALPNRSWQSVRSRAFALHLKRSTRTVEVPDMLLTLSLRDIELMNEYGISEAQVEEGQRVWWVDTIISEGRSLPTIAKSKQSAAKIMGISEVGKSKEPGSNRWKRSIACR